MKVTKQDHYATLGVARDVTSKELKQRFRVLARERHPDRFTGEEKARAEIEFQNLTEAFNILSDPEKRREHDELLREPTRKRNEPDQVAKVYLARGTKAYKEGKYTEAASSFHSAAKTAPDDAKPWYHLALACVEERRYLAQAREAIDRVLELEPEKAAYLKLAGRIYADSGLVSRAKAYYNQALRSGGSDAAVRKALDALGGASDRDDPDDRSKPSLFRKFW